MSALLSRVRANGNPFLPSPAYPVLVPVVPLPFLLGPLPPALPVSLSRINIKISRLKTALVCKCRA